MKDPLLTITIPSLPPSCNSMYDVLYSAHAIRLKPEARRWVTAASAFMGPCKEFKDSGLYEVLVEYRGQWFQKGKPDEPKTKDVRNYEKLITDTVFKRYGVNDKRIWKSTVEKVEAEDEEVIYRIWRLECQKLGG